MENEKLNVVRVRRRFVDSALIDCGRAAGECGAASCFSSILLPPP